MSAIPLCRIRIRVHETNSSVTLPAGATRTSVLRNSAPNRAPEPVTSGIEMLAAPARNRRCRRATSRGLRAYR
jgi:hypothetical protein